MDRTVRDLCCLRGTYRIIPDTEKSLRQIFRFLKRKQVASAVFYIDTPVFNSGKLKALILKIKEGENFPVEGQYVYKTPIGSYLERKMSFLEITLSLTIVKVG
jgi:hypothetical protein